MRIQEYVNKLMAKQCTNTNELVGKTIKFIMMKVVNSVRLNMNV